MRRLFLLAMLLPASLFGYGDKTTHDKLTKNTFQLVPAEYTELHSFKSEITFGSVAEDATPRYLYHFWDPTTGRGLPLNSYTAVFTSFHGVGASSSYTTAMDWAWDEMPDQYDWLGAIDSYGEGHRGRAYTGLGHVLHLLQDLGQPDHSRSRPHPGNYVENYVPGIPTVGYEGLFAQPNVTWPAGTNIVRHPSLQGFFLTMAELAQDAEDRLGLPMEPETALGLGPYTLVELNAPLTALGYAAGFRDNNWVRFELAAALVPLIPLDPTSPRYKKHLALGRDILPKIEEFGAGLLLHFHDIVNPPPYIEEIEIQQRGVTKYKKSWTGGDQGTTRTASGGESAPLIRDEPAMVMIRVGPRHPDPADLNVETRERLASITVKVRERGREIVLPLTEGGEERTPRGGIWSGTFTPKEGATFEIEAKDLDPHFPQRQPLGDVLDANPATRARATSADRYPWAGYEPGKDTNHSFTVTAPTAECRLDEENLRFGTWSGTVTIQSNHKGFDLRIGGKIWYETEVTETATARFRSRLRQCGEKSLNFGPGSGTFRIIETSKELVREIQITPGSERRVTSTETPKVTTETKTGALKADGHVNFNEGTASVSVSGDAEGGERGFGFSAPVTGAPCQLLNIEGSKLTESGAPADEFWSRHSETWSFRYEGPAQAAHAQLCPLCFDASRTDQALSAYLSRAISLLEPPLTTLMNAQRYDAGTRISNLMNEMSEAATAFSGDTEIEVWTLCDRASDQWLQEDAAYNATVAEITTKMRQVEAEKRRLSNQIVQITNRAVAAVEPVSPQAAAALRQLAQTLATQGWTAFGATPD